VLFVVAVRVRPLLWESLPVSAASPRIQRPACTQEPYIPRLKGNCPSTALHLSYQHLSNREKFPPLVPVNNPFYVPRKPTRQIWEPSSSLFLHHTQPPRVSHLILKSAPADPRNFLKRKHRPLIYCSPPPRQVSHMSSRRTATVFEPADPPLPSGLAPHSGGLACPLY
jgi:hypothetical protein